jgi:hypothetical protein
MGTIYFPAPGQSLADLAAEIVAEEWDDAYRDNFSLCQALSDEKGAGPPRISRERWEERKWRRVMGAEE